MKSHGMFVDHLWDIDIRAVIGVTIGQMFSQIDVVYDRKRQKRVINELRYVGPFVRSQPEIGIICAFRKKGKEWLLCIVFCSSVHIIDNSDRMISISLPIDGGEEMADHSLSHHGLLSNA